MTTPRFLDGFPIFFPWNILISRWFPSLPPFPEGYETSGLECPETMQNSACANVAGSIVWWWWTYPPTPRALRQPIRRSGGVPRVTMGLKMPTWSDGLIWGYPCAHHGWPYFRKPLQNQIRCERYGKMWPWLVCRKSMFQRWIHLESSFSHWTLESMSKGSNYLERYSSSGRRRMGASHIWSPMWLQRCSAAEFHQMLTFCSQWLAGARGHIGGSSYENQGGA